MSDDYTARLISILSSLSSWAVLALAAAVGALSFCAQRLGDEGEYNSAMGAPSAEASSSAEEQPATQVFPIHVRCEKHCPKVR